MRLGHVSHFAIETLCKSGGRAERDGGEIGRFRDADLRIGLRDRAFRGGDIGTALQQLRRNPERNAGGFVLSAAAGNRKRRCGLAGQQRDGMFVLGAQNADVRYPALGSAFN